MIDTWIKSKLGQYQIRVDCPHSIVGILGEYIPFYLYIPSASKIYSKVIPTPSSYCQMCSKTLNALCYILFFNYMLLAFQAAASSFRSIFPAADLGIACVCEEICVGDLL